MQRRINNTVVCIVTVFIVLAVAVVSILLLRYDTSSNSTISDSSSSGSAIQQFNNTSLLDNDASITYPWTLTGDSSNKKNNTNKEATYHDRPMSDFISIADMARGIVTPIKSTRSNNKCTDINKSLMRFTLVTDNYPVRLCVTCDVYVVCI